MIVKFCFFHFILRSEVDVFKVKCKYLPSEPVSGVQIVAATFKPQHLQYYHTFGKAYLLKLNVCGPRYQLSPRKKKNSSNSSDSLYHRGNLKKQITNHKRKITYTQKKQNKRNKRAEY